jgi:hypothetical protein
MRKAAVETRRESAEKKRAMLSLIPKDNNTRDLWDLARMDILQ